MFDTLDEELRDALQRDINEWAPGINIIAIRVTKPRIPEVIRRNYEQIEAEITKTQVAQQAHRLVEQEAQTEQRRAIINAEKEAAIQKIALERQMADAKNRQAIAQIENEMHMAKQKALTDASTYATQQEAIANRALLTPELLQLEAVRAIANNTKVFFGDRLPSLFVAPSTLLPSS